MEPFLGLDTFFDHIEGVQISHCDILDQGQLLESQYEGFGSCIFKETPFFEMGENSRAEKYIVIHMKLLDQHFYEFKIDWTAVTVGEVLFGVESKPIDIRVKITGGSWEEFVYYLGIALSESLDLMIDSDFILSFIERGQDSDQLKFQVIPIEEEVLEFKLTFLDSADVSVYEYSVFMILGSDESYIVSEDIYHSKFRAEFGEDFKADWVHLEEVCLGDSC